jgi:outer membrane protein OmpA-like peptidoglycan-associated protein
MAERGQSAAEDSFAQLRSIIVGPEQRKLRALQAHLADAAAQTRDVSRVLPDALQLRADDPQLKRALAPSIEEAITASVRKNPQALADAMFPVIGPAIRKAVAHAFDAMIDSVNQSIEQSVSWRALQWRWTAWRTGKPFAELVIANTLDYRVEQVLLIHRDTGLLLQQVAIDARAGQDADQISALLTAITDFARDSFQVDGGDSLDSLRVGELAVTIAQGPHAILAGVVRGSIPSSVRATFDTTLESVHRQFGLALQAFTGDAAVFAAARPLLEACLVSQRRRTQSRPRYRRWAIAAALVVVALGAWYLIARREQQRWNAYVDRLRAEPGLVVLASGERGGSHYVIGLRDPLALDPADLMAAANVNPDAIQSRWEPYQALHPPFVTARAALLLRPPGDVTLTFDDGRLIARGTAPQRWLDDSARIAPAIAGVREFRFEGERLAQRIAGEIERSRIGFAKGESSIDPSQERALAVLIEQLRTLDRELDSIAGRATVEVLGFTDSDGPDELNAVLSHDRADRVRQALASAALIHIDVTAVGVGRVLSRQGATPQEQEQNRRTSFRVRLPDSSSRNNPQ